MIDSYIDLSSYSIEDLQAMLEVIPSIIAERERDSCSEIEFRKKRVWQDLQALAAKQGLNFESLFVSYD